MPAVALPWLWCKTALGRKPTSTQGQRCSGAEVPELQEFPRQSLFAGAPLSSQHGQLPGKPKSFSRGLFHPYGCFRGSGQVPGPSPQRFPSQETFVGCPWMGQGTLTLLSRLKPV